MGKNRGGRGGFTFVVPTLNMFETNHWLRDIGAHRCSGTLPPPAKAQQPLVVKDLIVFEVFVRCMIVGPKFSIRPQKS